MSERWKPEIGKQYWVVVFNETVQSVWINDITDNNRWRMGNCFKTKEEAVAALKKLTALLLSLHEPTKECSQLPKLTSEVFDHPNCPEWAKYAAVDGDGVACYFAHQPTIAHGETWWSRAQKSYPVSAMKKFDASDWKNSLIERPAKENKLPDWCKVGEFVYMKALQIYKKIESAEELNYISEYGHWKHCCQARPRPYNTEEMKALVGRTVAPDYGAVFLVTKFVNTSEGGEVCVDSIYYNADKLLDTFTINDKPCGVLEHLNEKGEWVE